MSRLSRVHRLEASVSRVRKHLTFANTASALCLVLLTGYGTAHAATALGANTVGSAQIKNGQVKTADLGAGAVTSGKVAANALTGADIDEASLSGVNASEVGGLVAKKISAKLIGNAPKRTVLSFPGKLRIDASCVVDVPNVDYDTHIVVVSGEAGGLLDATSTRSGANDDDGIRDIASDEKLLPAGGELFVSDILPSHVDEQTSLDFSTPSGFVAHVDLYANPLFSGEYCRLAGIAIGG